MQWKFKNKVLLRHPLQWHHTLRCKRQHPITHNNKKGQQKSTRNGKVTHLSSSSEEAIAGRCHYTAERWGLMSFWFLQSDLFLCKLVCKVQREHQSLPFSGSQAARDTIPFFELHTQLVCLSARLPWQSDKVKYLPICWQKNPQLKSKAERSLCIASQHLSKSCTWYRLSYFHHWYHVVVEKGSCIWPVQSLPRGALHLLNIDLTTSQTIPLP